MRRGFNLIEMLMALAISAMLLTATMVALDASFMAYQSTTEQASTHTIARLAMNRILSLIRTGQEFGPFPLDPLNTIVESDFISFVTPNNQIMTLDWVAAEEALYVEVHEGEEPFALITRQLILEGVIAQTDAEGDPISPFTLEYELGRTLYRATIDLAVRPDDNMDTDLSGDNDSLIRLVASAMPRTEAY